MAGSEFSSYMWGEVDMARDHVKVLLVKSFVFFWEYVFFENFWKNILEDDFRKFHFMKVTGHKVT